MSSSRGLVRALQVAGTLALFAAAPASAQQGGAGDTKEISGYRLTDAGLAKYTQATRNLESVAKAGQDACESDDDENGVTIDQAVAKLNATAGAAAAVKAAGMTPREYVVFSMAVFQSGLASWALSQPGGKLPAGVSKDNVDFYRRHEAELAKLGAAKDESGCDDG